MRSLSSNKTGDLTITTIIVAAIGLLVLVVLIAVFTGRLGVFTQGVGEQQVGQQACNNVCQAQGYSPIGELEPGSDPDATCSSGTRVFGKYQKGGVDQICCCQPQS